ncbi:MAG: hypothetical protein R2823_04940 [Acidimicrobiia bacterium]
MFLQDRTICIPGRQLVTAAIIGTIFVVLMVIVSASAGATSDGFTTTHHVSHPADDITVTRPASGEAYPCNTAFNTTASDLAIGANGGDEAMASLLFRNVAFPEELAISHATLNATAAAPVTTYGSTRWLTVYAGPRAPAGEINSGNAPACSGTDLGDDVGWAVAVPADWVEGQVYPIDVTELLTAVRSGVSWQNGLDIAFTIRDPAGHFDGAGLEIAASDGGAPAALEITYVEADPSNRLIDPSSGFRPSGLGDALDDADLVSQSGGWNNLWTLKVHRITVFHDGDAIGPGDIFIMARPWLLGDSSGLGVFCWPADGIDAPIRVAPQNLGASGPGGQPVFDIPCPREDVWHIGNNESVTFSPPMSTTAFLLPSAPIEEYLWADCLPQGYFYVGEEDSDLSLYNPHQHLDTVGWRSGGDYVAFLGNPDRCHARPGEIITSTGVNGNVAIEYSFDLERHETLDVSWGAYLIGYEGLTAAIGWELGWWPLDVAGQSLVEASGFRTLPVPTRAVAVEAPGEMCIPLEVRTAGLVAESSCLEPGTYTATHHSIVASDGEPTGGGEPSVRFRLVRFAVGVEPPGCLDCQPLLPPWVFLSATALAGLAAVGLFWTQTAYARVGASFLAIAALTSAGLFVWTTVRVPTTAASEALQEAMSEPSPAVGGPVLFERQDSIGFDPEADPPGDEPPGDATVDPGDATGSYATTSSAATPTTAPEPSTTTTSSAAPTTTTTAPAPTTSVAPDTTGPKVSGFQADPATIFTNGNPPDVSMLTASVTDPSGIGTVSVFFRSGKNPFVFWGLMLRDRTGIYTNKFGPFSSLGVYEVRVRAVDAVGNANCQLTDLSTCHGGFVQVTIP